MSAQPAKISCSCGQFLFELGERKTGDLFTCPGCKKQFRYLGGEHIEPWDEALGNDGIVVVEGSEEIIVPRSAGSVTSVVRKGPSTKRREKTGTARSATKTNEPRPKKNEDAPGGVMTMIGFMIGFNVLAFVILHFGFPIEQDGTRMTPWGASIPKTKIPWPELTTLILGQVLGYFSWFFYVHWRHKKTVQPGAEESAEKPGSSAANEK